MLFFSEKKDWKHYVSLHRPAKEEVLANPDRLEREKQVASQLLVPWRHPVEVAFYVPCS